MSRAALHVSLRDGDWLRIVFFPDTRAGRRAYRFYLQHGYRYSPEARSLWSAVGRRQRGRKVGVR